MASHREDSKREEMAIKRRKWVNTKRGNKEKRRGESEKMEIMKQGRGGEKVNKNGSKDSKNRIY